MKNTILAVLLLLLTACEVQLRTPDNDSGIGVTYVYTYDICEEDPYWYEPEWCDWYDSGATCCVWYTDGWYEEWCQWAYDWCWEYNGSF
jgi:hypothetical protein